MSNYRLIEKPFRIDGNDVEICGARQPYGHDYYVIYTTMRVTSELHQVIAPTREVALLHVKLIAGLWSAAVKAPAA